MPKKVQGQNAIGAVRPLDSTRSRRAGAQAAAGKDIAAPLALDAQGRRTVGLDGPLFENAQGKVDFRVGDGLEVTPGSPRAARLRLDDDSGLEIGVGGVRMKRGSSLPLNARGEVEARPTAAEVSETTDGDTQSAIDRLGAALASLEAQSVIETRTDDPASPELGRIWLRTDL